MTITQFLEQCKRLSPQRKRLALSWVLRKRLDMCPINAVIRNMTGKRCTNNFTNGELKLIGLRRRDANSIMNVADDAYTNNVRLRKRLIEALS